MVSGKFCYFLPDCVAVDGQLKSTSNTIQNVKVAAETCSVGKHLSGSLHLKLCGLFTLLLVTTSSCEGCHACASVSSPPTSPFFVCFLNLNLADAGAEEHCG